MHCGQCGLDHEGEKPRQGRKPKAETAPSANAVKTRRQTQTQQPTPDVATNWLPSTELSRDELQKAQLADPQLSEVIQWVQKGERPEYREI